MAKQALALYEYGKYRLNEGLKAFVELFVTKYFRK
jgi:hypothetical protein